jgi:hypothetical protein
MSATSLRAHPRKWPKRGKKKKGPHLFSGHHCLSNILEVLHLFWPN